MGNRVNLAQITGETERFHGNVVDGRIYVCCYDSEAKWRQRSTTGCITTTVAGSGQPPFLAISQCPWEVQLDATLARLSISHNSAASSVKDDGRTVWDDES